MDPSPAAASTPVGDIDALIAQLQAIVADPKGAAVAGAIDEAKRLQLKQLTRAASVALEEPFETVQRLVYSVSLFSFLFLFLAALDPSVCEGRKCPRSPAHLVSHSMQPRCDKPHAHVVQVQHGM